jgi:predicted ATPase
LPQWLVLDDPGQSLDQDCLAGLADAVAEVSERTPVLIATYPGALATTLEHSALANKRVFHLSPNAGSDDSTIREVRP